MIILVNKAAASWTPTDRLSSEHRMDCLWRRYCKLNKAKHGGQYVANGRYQLIVIIEKYLRFLAGSSDRVCWFTDPDPQQMTSQWIIYHKLIKELLLYFLERGTFFLRVLNEFWIRRQSSLMRELARVFVLSKSVDILFMHDVTLQTCVCALPMSKQLFIVTIPQGAE